MKRILSTLVAVVLFSQVCHADFFGAWWTVKAATPAEKSAGSFTLTLYDECQRWKWNY